MRLDDPTMQQYGLRIIMPYIGHSLAVVRFKTIACPE